MIGRMLKVTSRWETEYSFIYQLSCLVGRSCNNFGMGHKWLVHDKISPMNNWNELIGLTRTLNVHQNHLKLCQWEAKSQTIISCFKPKVEHSRPLYADIVRHPRMSQSTGLPGGYTRSSEQTPTSSLSPQSNCQTPNCYGQFVTD